jgi:heptaprenyl diphosphate synthase
VEYKSSEIGEIMNLLDIYMRKKKDIQWIEHAIEQSIEAESNLLRKSSLHLVKAGGKRIRPVFVLLSGEFGAYHLEKLKHVAVSLELIHMATLVHDDVIDNADKRRGQLTVRSKWDNQVAMYTGDYIFGKALIEVTQLENPRIHQILSKAIVEMCLGELEQIRLFFQLDQTLRDYLLRIKRKTALLLAISCQLGALAVDADEKYVTTLYNFGYNAGMAFQVTDDLLDIEGTESQIGKPPGSDVRQGNITLPYLLALQDEQRGLYVRQLITKIQNDGNEQHVQELVSLIRLHPAIKQTREIANRYLTRAKQALKQLPDGRAKQDLEKIAQFIQERTY